MTDDVRRQGECTNRRGGDEERGNECDCERVRSAEQPVDRFRRFALALLLLLREVRNEEPVELLLERRDAALDGLQLSPDGDDQRAPVLAQCLVVRALLRTRLAELAGRRVREPRIFRVGKWERELNVAPVHLELNRRVGVRLDEENLVRSVRV